MLIDIMEGAQQALLSIAMQLKPGQAYNGVTHRTMLSAAIADMPLLDRMAGGRRSDIDAFLKKVEPNWNIRCEENPMTGIWTIYSTKPTESNGEQNG